MKSEMTEGDGDDCTCFKIQAQINYYTSWHLHWLLLIYSFRINCIVVRNGFIAKEIQYVQGKLNLIHREGNKDVHL